MTPAYAWAPSGERAFDVKPARGSNISMVGALKNTGMQALYPYDGAVDGDKILVKHHNEFALFAFVALYDLLQGTSFSSSLQIRA